MGRIAYRVVCALFACVIALGASAPSLRAAETTQYTYDALGRVVSAIDASGKKVAYTYDSAGNRTRVSNGAEFTEILPTAWSTSSNGGTTGLSTTNGMRDGGFYALNSIHVTNVETGPWVMADLGSVQNVNHIAVAAAIESTTGVTLADLNDTAVEYSADGTIWNTAATIEGVSPGATKTVSLGGVALRYLRIHRLASGRVGLGDLQIYSAAAANTPLVANPYSITSTGGAVTFDPRINDLDNDGYAMAISGADPPPHGTVIINAGVSLTYTPNAGYFGADSFLYTVTDGHNGTASAVVTVMVQSSTNHPPVAVPDQFNISDRATAVVDGINDLRPLNNDYDPDGDVLSITGTTSPSHGTVSVIGSSLVRYQPTVGYSGSDTFNYTISDGRGGTATAAITVNSSNTNPVAVQDNVSTAQGQAVTLDPRLNDSDPNGDPISITAITQPTNGVATLNANQSVTYTPNPGFVGGDSMNYTLSDGRGGTATGLISITVLPAPPPNAVSDSIAATGGTPVTFDPRSNDSDPQNRPLTIIALTAPGHGTAVIGSSGTAVTYTATSGYGGIDSFTYTIANDQGATATATVSVNALSVEYLVVGGGGGGGNVEGGGGGAGGLLQGVTPTGVGSLTVTVGSGGAGGAPGANGGSSSLGSLIAAGGGGGGYASGAYLAQNGGSGGGGGGLVAMSGGSGTSGQGFKGGDSVSHEAAGGGGAGAPGQASPTGSAAGAGGAGVNSSISGSLANYAAGGGGGGYSNGDDVNILAGAAGGTSGGAGGYWSDAGQSAPSNLGGGGGGALSTTGGSGGSGVVILRYRGAPKATGGTITQIGGYTIHTFTTGGTLAVTSTNGAPVAVNDSVVMLQNTTLIFDPRTNDSDPNGDALTVIAVGSASHGVATVANTGQVSYQPTIGFTGTDTFTYTISDGEGLTSTATVTATVQTSGVFEYLVVAGGGGGGTAGNGGGGGGGGGGVVYSQHALTSGLSLSIAIGGGGTTEANGANTTIGVLAMAIGGGHGARGNIASASGNGGSGGGGGGDAAGYGAGTPGQGSDGAPGNSGGGGGGGGGGAAGPGVSGPAGGNGGSGYLSSLSGASVAYGAGGGGGGALGGGVAGAANSGNGGGGWPSSGTGAAGGSGIVIIRYPGSQVASGGMAITSGGYTIHTFTSSGTFTVP
ncbi:Ig-like domain-containing protein [Phenylobacterium sp.]|jgi:YD repeat-containing protein|uniref:Ig-like domain-containing protein n=1 Tax=Phenylobacterium sp. TaxID=1871053 RepID=UPI002E337EE2|nr:Ig-like domain-containing protein [Phenylobacterium sp.]HEX3365601.1 Ig-like domain-containing protein [Phenylobacterium sp.]